MGTKWSERSLIHCTNSRCICWFCWSMLSLSSFNRWIVWIWAKQKGITYWEKKWPNCPKGCLLIHTILISNAQTLCCNETISLDNPRLSLNFQLQTWNMSIKLKRATLVEMDYREKKNPNSVPSAWGNMLMGFWAFLPPSVMTSQL